MANRHQAYWMTLGSALAASGRHDAEALVAFIRAERAAPSTFRMNRWASSVELPQKADGELPTAGCPGSSRRRRWAPVSTGSAIRVSR